MVWYDILEFNVPYSTQYRSFRRRLVRWPALLETRASRLQSARKRLADYTHPSCVLEEALITCVQVCIRSAMFSLLARMRYGLYYNMPLVRRGFGDNALYKSTFYLLTYLLTCHVYSRFGSFEAISHGLACLDVSETWLWSSVRFLTQTLRNVFYVRVGKCYVRSWRSQRSRTVVWGERVLFATDSLVICTVLFLQLVDWHCNFSVYQNIFSPHIGRVFP